jgi:ribosomal-protein-serine acetyltransferase
MVRIAVEDGLYLKSLELREAEPLLLLVDANRPYLRRWLPWLDMTKNIDEMIAFVESALRQHTSGLGFQTGVWYAGELAGIIGYHHLEWANRSTCVGYWLAERYQGHGIMTKACNSIVEYAFDDWRLNRVEIRCAMENVRSRAIPERLGFKTEGVLREAEWLYDHYVDHVVYGMLAKQWLGSRHRVHESQTVSTVKQERLNEVKE